MGPSNSTTIEYDFIYEVQKIDVFYQGRKISTSVLSLGICKFWAHSSFSIIKKLF